MEYKVKIDEDGVKIDATLQIKKNYFTIRYVDYVIDIYYSDVEVLSYSKNALTIKEVDEEYTIYCNEKVFDIINKECNCNTFEIDNDDNGTVFEEENALQKLENGEPVHKHRTSGLGGLILATSPMAILMIIFLKGTGVVLAIGIYLIIAFMVMVARSGSYSPGKGKCPYCKELVLVDCILDRMKLQCPYCKKIIGLYDMHFYKINDNNKELFQTEAEKTNELLRKRVKEENDNYNHNDDKTYTNRFDNYEEVKKLKELLDMGAITKEEYEKKKKELLKL